jgi:protein-S-isoprenylcysteine O-methyltransferase Ste14
MRNGKTTKPRRSPVIMVFELALLFGAPILCHYLFPLATLISGPLRLTGIILMILGPVLASAGAREFRRAGTGFRMKDGGVSLVTSGPFRFSRNPIYMAMLIWLLGLAVLLGSLMAFLYPLLFFVLTNFLLIPPEEKKLRDAFGESFANYCRKVRRWFLIF